MDVSGVALSPVSSITITLQRLLQSTKYALNIFLLYMETSQNKCSHYKNESHHLFIFLYDYIANYVLKWLGDFFFFFF